MGRIPIRQASDILSSFMDRELTEKAERASGFFRSWKQVVGERLSAHSRVAEVERGVVIVEADHPSWIQLLQLRQEEILSSIKRGWPELQVRAVAFRLESETPRPKPKIAPEGRASTDEAAKADAFEPEDRKTPSSSIDSIKDDRLKSALERLRTSVKRRTNR